uniref:Cnidarian restricted protein n=1 Tax=Clytia hemisphaerica TaxID=252671 RepID=A0A7M5WRC7_9CNID|eukprot:TCONS_00014464-protein
MARWYLLVNTVLVCCFLVDAASIKNRQESTINNNIEQETNRVDTFLTRLTSALAERVRDKLDKHHDLSQTEVKLLRFFVTRLQKGSGDQPQEKRKSKKEILSDDVDLESLLHQGTDLPQTIPVEENKENTAIQTSKSPKLPKTFAIKKPSSKETDAKENQSFDEFIIKLSTALAQRVKDKLSKDHALTQNEVQLLEFFVKQIREKKSLSGREQESQDSEGQSNHESPQTTTTEKPKTFMNNIDLEINNLIQELTEDNHTISYHPNEIAIDPTDLIPRDLHSKELNNAAIKDNKLENIDSKQQDKRAVTTDDSTKNILRDFKNTLNSDASTTKDLDGVDDKILDVVKNYVDSMKQIKKNIDSVSEDNENKMLNDVLSFVTKKKKISRDQREVLSPEEAQKQRQFAQKFWTDLGMNTQADELTDKLENVVKKAVHCVDRPVKDCRRVCIHGDPSNCQNVCVNSTEMDCINI